MQFKRFMSEMEVDLSTGEEVKQSAPSPVASVQTQPDDQPQSSIKMDVPLFIRVLEYSRENAKTDQELHQLTERAASMSTEKTLTMEDYEALVAELRQSPDDPNAAPPKEYATMKADPAVDSDKVTAP